MQLLSSGLAKPSSVMRHRPVVQGILPSEAQRESPLLAVAAGRQGSKRGSGGSCSKASKKHKAKIASKSKQQPFLTAGPKCHWAAKQLSPKRELSEWAWELAAQGSLEVAGAQCSPAPLWSVGLTALGSLGVAGGSARAGTLVSAGAHCSPAALCGWLSRRLGQGICPRWSAAEEWLI